MNGIAFITGGDRGIGRAVMRKFASQGFSIIISYNKNEDEAKKAVEEALNLGAKEAYFIKINLLSNDSIINARKEVGQLVDHINVLVNNAGVISYASIEEITLDEWLKTLGVDLTGPFLVTKYFLEMLKKSNWASIINIASIAGQTGNVYAGIAYSVAKAGLIGFTKRLATDLARYGIRVNAVAPSFVETDMVSDVLRDEKSRESIIDLHPLKMILKPEDVAEAVYFLAIPKMSRGITGHVLSINAGRYT